MEKVIRLELDVTPAQRGTYFTLPFEMPANIETLTVRYQYARRGSVDLPMPGGIFTARPEINIIDIGLIDPRGRQVGASGSDKLEFTISEVAATPGYQACALMPGEWQLLVGAYQVAPEGVKVAYEIRLVEKSLRLLKGDLHLHTFASDGVSSAEELGWRARRSGLDFIAITDHNQIAAAAALPRIPALTLIPGVEWTHYQGHANFLGVDRPYDAPFHANSFEEAQARFISARERGALITLNHPFEPGMGMALDMQRLPFDCLEIWNGPMRESNLRAVGFWQKLLESGQKTPAVGGSDYHRDTPFIFPGGPTTCVYALSNGISDILAALKAGHAYLSFAPDGPSLRFGAGDAILGDSVKWSECKECQLDVDGLLAGDVVRVLTGQGAEVLAQAPEAGHFAGKYAMPAPGFARVEVLRAFLPGLPLLPALLSNPIYFDA